MKGILIVEVYDGKLLSKLETESRSFVQNLAKVLASAFSAVGGEAGGVSGVQRSTTVTDYNGLERTVWTHWYSGDVINGGGVFLAMNADAGVDSYGILVGSGSTPVSYNDYNLALKISHGTGAGQLTYQSHSTSSSFSSTSSYVEINRTFVNNSGSTVTVREVGLMARAYWKDVNAVRQDEKYLVARDVLPAPVDVPNLATLVVRYRVGLTL